MFRDLAVQANLGDAMAQLDCYGDSECFLLRNY